MSSSAFILSLLLGLIALATINAQAGYTTSDGLWRVYPPAPYTYSNPTFAQLTAASARRQWGVSIYADPGAGAAAGTWTKVVCNSSVYGACFGGSNPSPYDQPLDWNTARINITFAYTKNNFVTAPWSNGQPHAIQFYLCYSDNAFNDRPWRKKNKAYPSLTNNCQGPDKVFNLLQPAPAPTAEKPEDKAPSLPFPTVANLSALTAAEKTALSGSIAFNLKDNDQITTATWFVMMWVWCTDGQVCAFETTEAASTLNSTGLYYPQPYTGTSIYIQTTSYDAITSGMMAASIILGIFGPLSWILYTIADHFYYIKTGKVLQFSF